MITGRLCYVCPAMLANPPLPPLPFQMPFGKLKHLCWMHTRWWRCNIQTTAAVFLRNVSQQHQLNVSMSGLGVSLSHARLHCTFFFFSALATNCRTDCCFFRGRYCIKSIFPSSLCNVALQIYAGHHTLSKMIFFFFLLLESTFRRL